mgnify:FL=1
MKETTETLRTEKQTKKASKKLNKAKVLLGSVVVVVIIAYLLNSIINLIKNPTDTFIVREGKISKEEAAIGYIIREETVVKGENYKNGMEQIIDEGSRVAKGESIFRYYSSGENSLKEKIKALDIKIQETIENNNSNELVLADTRLLDSQIDQALSDINTLNNIQKIQETKKKLNTYISKKARIAGENSPSGSYLRKLIDERSKYENELNNGSEYVKAPVSGMVSYRVDGLEETLTTNDFSKYNKEFLNNLNLKTGQIISTSSETGKIINNFKCYIACTSKSEEAKKAEVGDKIKITLPSTKNVDAKIEYIIKENDDEVTLVLSFSEGIDELLMYRKISFDIIWWDQSGYKVANTAIIEDNGLNYVIRTKAGYLERVLVKVKKRGEDYSIVSNYSTSEIKELGNVNKNARTSIILYDELILNPKEGQINETK